MDDLISINFSNTVYTDLDYECFEELLLRSNLVNKLIKIDELDEARLNSELSRETVYERLLKDITAGLPFETGHDKRLNFCWKSNCNECNRNKKHKCEFYIEGDKISNLLIGTKYEKYLEL